MVNAGGLRVRYKPHAPFSIFHHYVSLVLSLSKPHTNHHALPSLSPFIGFQPVCFSVEEVVV